MVIVFVARLAQSTEIRVSHASLYGTDSCCKGFSQYKSLFFSSSRLLAFRQVDLHALLACKHLIAPFLKAVKVVLMKNQYIVVRFFAMHSCLMAVFAQHPEDLNENDEIHTCQCSCQLVIEKQSLLEVLVKEKASLRKSNRT